MRGKEALTLRPTPQTTLELDAQAATEHREPVVHAAQREKVSPRRSAYNFVAVARVAAVHRDVELLPDVALSGVRNVEHVAAEKGIIFLKKGMNLVPK